MYPLDEGVNWADELQAYVDAETEMLLGYTSCIVGDTTYPLEFQSALNNFTSRVFRITLKEATETESAEVLSAPFIWTKSGAKFYEPLTIDGVTVEELSFSGEYLENAEKNVRITPKYSDNQLTVNITETTYNSLKYEITATDPGRPVHRPGVQEERNRRHVGHATPEKYLRDDRFRERTEEGRHDRDSFRPVR